MCFSVFVCLLGSVSEVVGGVSTVCCFCYVLFVFSLSSVDVLFVCTFVCVCCLLHKLFVSAGASGNVRVCVCSSVMCWCVCVSVSCCVRVCCVCYIPSFILSGTCLCLFDGLLFGGLLLLVGDVYLRVLRRSVCVAACGVVPVDSPVCSSVGRSVCVALVPPLFNTCCWSLLVCVSLL